MQTIAVANQKGGVGKTTVATNLAAGLGLKGHRVLLIDMDPQANATLGVVGRLPNDIESAAHVLVDAARLSNVIVPTSLNGVSLVPGSADLSKADMTLQTRLVGRELVLQRALQEVATSFDFAIIDTSPYLGLLTVNSLLAARHVLIPVSPEYFSAVGLNQLLNTVGELKQVHPTVSILGYVVTMMDRRIASTGEMLELLEQQFGSLVFAAKVRTNSNLKVAPAHQKSIYDFEASQRKPWKGIEDFTRLTDELLSRVVRATAPVAA